MTSRPVDILVSVDRESPRTLGRQIEDQLRQAIRDLTLRPGSRLPSTRDLARELGVSRPIVVDAYAQLAGEGYLELRPGSRPRVTGCSGPCQPPPPGARTRFRSRGTTSVPARPTCRPSPAPPGCARSARRWPGCGTPISATPIPRGPRCSGWRSGTTWAGCAAWWPTPAGWSSPAAIARGGSLLCHALASMGAKRIAIEDPCHGEVRLSGRERRPGAGAGAGGRRGDPGGRAGAGGGGRGVR